MILNINADLGEGIGVESEIMPLLTSCSVACGGHAGNLDSMNSVVEIAKKHNVKIGAHPSYPDKDGFGRRIISISNSDLKKTILDQIDSLSNILNKKQLELDHIKTHGALYNYSANNYDLGMLIIELVNKNYQDTPLYVPSGTLIAKLAVENNILIKNEVFLDRNYNDDYSLVNRSNSKAMIDSSDEMVKRIKNFVESGYILSINKKKLVLKVDTFCVHGDSLNISHNLKQLKKHLDGKL